MDGWIEGGREGGREGWAGGEIDTNLLISRIGQVPLPQMESRLRRDGSIVDVRICSRFDPASNKLWKSSRGEKNRRPPQTKRRRKKEKVPVEPLSPAPSPYHRPNIDSPFPFPSIPFLSFFFNFYLLKTKIHKIKKKKKRIFPMARGATPPQSLQKNAKRRVITHDTKSLPRHGTIPSFPTWRLNEDDKK